MRDAKPGSQLTDAESESTFSKFLKWFIYVLMFKRLLGNEVKKISGDFWRVVYFPGGTDGWEAYLSEKGLAHPEANSHQIITLL